MPRFPGPWAYAGAGLAGGVGEGLMLGMQAARERRRDEETKRARALQLLLGGYKLAESDPEAAQSLFKQMGINDIKLPTAQERVQKQVGQFQSIVDALGKQYPNMEEDRKNMIAAGMLNFPWHQPKEKPPTYMRGPNGELIPMEPGAKIVGGSGYPPAWAGDPWAHMRYGYGPNGEPVPITPGNIPPDVSLVKPTEERPEPAKTPTPQERAQIEKDIETWKDPSAEPGKREFAKQNLEQWGIQTGEKEEVIKTHPWGERLGLRTGTKIRTKIPSVTLPQRIEQSRRMQGGGAAPGGRQQFEQLPDPAQFKGKTLTNPVTKERVKSDGTKWVPVR